MYSKNFLARTLTVILLVLLLVGCGSNTYVGSPVATATPSKTTEKSTYLGMQGIIFRVGNLQIRSTGGIHCEDHTPFNLPSDGGNLVLATDRLKYDSAELQQMEAYAQSYYDGTDSPSLLPSTLAWVPGADKFRLLFFPIGCFGELLLTNVGKDTIQIQSMNMRITSTPRRNESRQHHLVNLCSLLPPDECPGGRAGPGQFYNYYLLNPAQSSKVFSPQPLALNEIAKSQTTTNLTLASNETAQVDVTFDSSQNNLIYPIMPELVLSTPDGQQTIALPRLATTLYFADPSQFSCYTLKGDTFVPSKYAYYAFPCI